MAVTMAERLAVMRAGAMVVYSAEKKVASRAYEMVGQRAARRVA